MPIDWAYAPLLALHVAAGVAALALGPLAAAASIRRSAEARLGNAYQVAVAALTSGALGLVALAPGRLWWLAPIAVATEAAALGGRRLASRATAAARAWRIRLLGGSYVSLVTALLVVSWGTWAAWVLPSVVGVVAVETAALPRGRRLLLNPEVTR